MKRIFLFSFLILVSSLNVFASDEPLELQLSKQQKHQVLESAIQAIQQKYTFLEWKKNQVGIDSEIVFESCRKGMNQDGIDFIDAIQTCLAQFRDFHLYARLQTPRPVLTLGLYLSESKGRFYVSGRLPGLAGGTSPLKIGDEISSLDGLPISYLLKKHARFFSAGTPAASMNLALENITQRRHLWPSRGFALIQVKGRALPIRLPWYSVGINQNHDSQQRLEQLGIKNIRFSLKNVFRIEDLDERIEGYSVRKPMSELELVVFRDENGRPGLRMGQYEFESQKRCYLQLLTFSAPKWRGPKGQNLPFEGPIHDFLKACNQSSMPIVLDLRWNSGGDPALAMKAARLFAEANQILPGLLTSGRRTRHLSEVLSKLSLGEDWLGTSAPEYSLQLLLSGLYRAIDLKEAYLPFVSGGNLQPMTTPIFDSSKNESAKIAWIGPDCASACEIFVNLLSRTCRVKFLGSELQGTAGGTLHVGEGELPNSQWRDDLYGSLTIFIPNTITVVSERLVQQKEYFLDFNEGSRLIQENRAFDSLDVEHQPDLPDWLWSGQSWKTKTEKLLQQ